MDSFFGHLLKKHRAGEANLSDRPYKTRGYEFESRSPLFHGRSVVGETPYLKTTV
ncbi:MAG: hypothetical protein ACI8V2_002833 [Candidatus Latescibacterota bacterium]|jgi:hypothetical protein